MKIDLSQRLKINHKKYRMGLLLTLLFAFLLVGSVCLFIFLSNYHIETLMAVIGSVTASLLMIGLITVDVLLLLPMSQEKRFLNELNHSGETEITGTITSLEEETITLRKGILSYTVYLDDHEYFLSFDELKEFLQEQKTVTLNLRGNFITGVRKDAE